MAKSLVVSRNSKEARGARLEPARIKIALWEWVARRAGGDHTGPVRYGKGVW